MRTAVRAAAVAAAFFAAGCTLAPRYERPAAPVSGAFPADGVYAAQPGAAPGARSANGQAAVDIGWREFFVDPRLQRLIEIALKNNRDLRVSVLNVEASRAQYQITRAGLFPTLSGTGTGTIQRTPAGVSITGQPLISRTYNVGVSASWELDLFGRVQSLKDQALAQYFATAQARKAAEISLVASVADQYLTLLSTDDLLQVTQNTLKSARASYDLTKLQFDNGTGSELDLRQAQTVVETALASQQAQARARAQALNALVLLIGEPLPDDLPAGLPLNAQNLLTDIPAGLPSDLLTRRPDIMQAEETLRAANANIGAARAAFFPKISLTSAFGYREPDARRPVQGGHGGVVVRAEHRAADLRGRAEHREPRSRARAEAHRDRELREGDPERVSRGVGRACRARHVRSADRGARAQRARAAAPLRSVGPALQERRRQLSVGADRADGPVFGAAAVDQRAARALDEPRGPVSRAGRRVARARGRDAAPGGRARRLRQGGARAGVGIGANSGRDWLSAQPDMRQPNARQHSARRPSAARAGRERIGRTWRTKKKTDREMIGDTVIGTDAQSAMLLHNRTQQPIKSSPRTRETATNRKSIQAFDITIQKLPCSSRCVSQC
ncbi:efflux transporter, outer membrane factor (OMF) lipo, NodT family protein [Burkholderia pseudomallei]|uniref:Efflux transporter, outer membrane factor (OMF) lipo, NodT family protein n=9 Tax=Burkholderiaceae TaxID=119060 RepID=A0AA40JEN2_BURPE|nr:efflux transporter, outer membrane factor (OMF) lipo, NodT family protein [Burkholderia pseudomallei]